MCGSLSSLDYSPRRPVAVILSTAPTGREDQTSREGSGGVGYGSGTPPEGPSQTAFMRNLRVPMPIGRKVRLVIRNTAIKVKTRQTCCGHRGEPGC
jgi:hypothetical protein